MAYLYFQLSTTDDLISAAIRWFTDGDVSHIDYVTPRGTLIGSHYKGGVQERSWGYGKFTKTRYIRFACTDEQAKFFDTFMRGEIGQKYNLRACLNVSLQIPWGDRLLKNGFTKWFCSELTAYGKLIAGVVAFSKSQNVWLITPRDYELIPAAEPVSVLQVHDWIQKVQLGLVAA